MVTIGGGGGVCLVAISHGNIFSVTSFLNFFLRLLVELSGYCLNQMEDEVGTDPNGSEMYLGVPLRGLLYNVQVLEGKSTLYICS